LYPDCERWVLTDEMLRERLGSDARPLPPNDAPDDEQRDFVAWFCLHVRGAPVDAVFTSELYGEGFAARLTRRFRETGALGRDVAHVMVDFERRRFPVSGSAIRADLWRHWHLLPAPVARSFVGRVALLGGESSGKSTLAVALARALDTASVHEYGRELWVEKGGDLPFEDFALIGRVQIGREDEAAARARRFVFCDTTPLTTLFYCYDSFGRADPELLEAAARRYETTVLCAPDFDFVQDGSRRDDKFRALQTEWYERELAARDMPYTIVGGTLEERVEKLRRELID
jgi:HTH-type transcriptional regulator, transcriptional repressor of NAD biosynthesis genes